MGEEIAVDALCARLCNVFGNNVILHKKVVGDEKIKTLFVNASKRLTNYQGYPDVVLEVSPNTLVVCECKRSRKDHVNTRSEPLDTSKPDKYACSGTIHYIRQAYLKDPTYDYVGIAYTQENKGGDYLADIYTLNKRYTPSLMHHPDSTISDIPQILKKMQHFESFFHKQAFSRYDNRKAIYLSASDISRLQIVAPTDRRNFQRILNNTHAKAICDTLVNSGKMTPGSAVIGVYCDEMYILDGQHRIEASKQLLALGKNVSMLVEIVYYEKHSDMVHDFMNINMAASHTDLDRDILQQQQQQLQLLQQTNKNNDQTTPSVGLLRAQVIKKAIMNVCDYISTKGGALVLTTADVSKRPRISKKNMQRNLEVHVQDADKFQEYTTVLELETYLKKRVDLLNAKFKSIKTTNAKKEHKITQSMRKISDGQGFYLGLVMREEWVFEL